MSNVYMYTLIDGKAVDITDLPQVMLHSSKATEKFEELNKTMDFETAADKFCSSCGNYKGNKDCKCMKE